LRHPFMPPGSVRIERVLVNGRPRAHVDPNYFRIELQESDRGATIAVVFSATTSATAGGQGSGRRTADH
jgi:hypothetical protein